MACFQQTRVVSIALRVVLFVALLVLLFLIVGIGIGFFELVYPPRVNVNRLRENYA